MKQTVFLLMLVVIVSLPHGLGAANPPPVSMASPFPFGLGERLTYDVFLNESNLGKAVMEVLGRFELGGREVFHIISRVRSNKLTSIFFKIDDRVESYMDVEELYSHGIKIDKRRRSKREEKEVDFDQERHQAVQYKNNERETFDIPPRVHDFLSSLYFLRTQRTLEPGASVSIDVHQNEKNWELEAHVLGRESVTTSAGTFRTVKVLAEVPSDGLFKDGGNLTIWFTDDFRRLPVKMQSEAKRGLIVVALSSKREGGSHLITKN